MEDQIYNLLAKHFAGETNEGEKNIINTWLQKDPDNQEQFGELKNIWEKTNHDTTDWNVNGAWKNVASKTKIKNESVSAYQPFKISAKSRFNIVRAAAVLLIVIGGYFLLSQFGIINFYRTSNSDWIENVTTPGEKSELTLPDKSRIILNASSKLKYPKHFLHDKREVELEGEAYFEITHKPDLPFIVHTGNISTTVLGTKFNVSAFANEKNISVSLVEGKVKVSKKELNDVQPIIILQPRQQLVYNRESKVGIVEQFDIDKTIGWKDNILKFDNEPLSQVLVRLERAYGPKFELASNSFMDFKVTANFRNESCFTVTEVLKKLTGLEANTIKENNEIKKIIFEEK